MASKPKLLVCELWGIGDLTLATTLIDQARGQFEVHLLAKPYARNLLGPTYSDIVFDSYTAPWTTHYRKYHLWKWRWNELFKMIVDLRREKFDVAVSVRPDPRDHFLMWVCGARRRIGFPIKGSGIFLHERLCEPKDKWHRVESYRELGKRIGLAGIETANPRIDGDRYRTERVDQLLRITTKPIVTAHLGAGQPVRRWPEHYWRETLQQLREQFDFHFVLVPDSDGFGAPLQSMADGYIDNLSVCELVDLMARSNLVVCHDSGPMHVAAACGIPTIALFGPGEWRWFRPWGDDHRIVIRDICPYRPCFDFCQFPENYCLTKMLPGEVWPEIKEHFERAMTSLQSGRQTIRASASKP
jgi:ADP-heptose:LPS heptosyltransferase